MPVPLDMDATATERPSGFPAAAVVKLPYGCKLPETEERKATRGRKPMPGSDAKVASSLTAMVSKLEDLEQLLDVLMDGVVILDGEGRFLHLNRGAEKAFGISRQEIKGRSFWEAPTNLRLESDPREENGKLLFKKVLQEGETLSSMRLTLDRPDGTSGFYLVNATPWRRDGERLGMLAVFTDVTETRRAERERSRVHAKLEATVQSLAHGVIIYDADGAIVSANPKAEEITGFPAETFSLSFADRWGQLQVETPEGKTLAPEQMPMVRALRGERLSGAVLVFRHSPERAAWVAVNAAPIICEGETVGAVVSFSDLTDLHRLRQRDETFMRMVSHDIRLPLTVIHGTLNCCGQGSDRPTSRIWPPAPMPSSPPPERRNGSSTTCRN